MLQKYKIVIGKHKKYTVIQTDCFHMNIIDETTET